MRLFCCAEYLRDYEPLQAGKMKLARLRVVLPSVQLIYVPGDSQIMALMDVPTGNTVGSF